MRDVGQVKAENYTEEVLIKQGHGAGQGRKLHGGGADQAGAWGRPRQKTTWRRC